MFDRRRWRSAASVATLGFALAAAPPADEAAALPQETTSAGTGMDEDGAIVATAGRHAESSQANIGSGSVAPQRPMSNDNERMSAWVAARAA